MYFNDRYEFRQWGQRYCLITRFRETCDRRSGVAFAGADYEVIEGLRALAAVGDLFGFDGRMPMGLRDFAMETVGRSGPTPRGDGELAHTLLEDLQDWCGNTLLLRSKQPERARPVAPGPEEAWTRVDFTPEEPDKHTLEYEALDERDAPYAMAAYTLAAPGDDGKPGALDGDGYRYHDDVRRGTHTLAASAAVFEGELDTQHISLRLQRAGGGALGPMPFSLAPDGGPVVQGVTDAAGMLMASWPGGPGCTLTLPEGGPRYVVAIDGAEQDTEDPTLLSDGVPVQAGPVALEVGGFPATVIEMHDTLFRTESAVVMPGGAAPAAQAGDEGATEPEPGGVGLIAACLRFASEHADKQLLIAGHTDSTGDDAFNLTLSEARARSVHACLVGDRDGFVEVARAHHTVADYKQILTWVAQAHGFSCAPAAIDDDARSGEAAVRAFQREYNRYRAVRFANSPELDDDGDIGPMTWGALFDCYDAALCDELGDGIEGLAALREGLSFVEPEIPCLGFGEHCPVDALGFDDRRSQENRRVEVLFFDPGEAPDVASARAAPADSELYRKGVYAAEAPPPMASAKRPPKFVVLWNAHAFESSEGLKLEWQGGAARTRVADSDASTAVLEGAGIPDGELIALRTDPVVTEGDADGADGADSADGIAYA